jgi:hypothetical protein
MNLCVRVLYIERDPERGRERRGEERLNKKLRPKAKQFLKK